jgi:hypothetical protein
MVGITKLVITSIKNKNIQTLFNTAPLWANYLAMDKDGELYWFENKPELTCSKLNWKDYNLDGRVKEAFLYDHRGYGGKTDALIWKRSGK